MKIEYVFLAVRLFGFIAAVAIIVLVGAVLIKAKRKRREKMKEEIHVLLNGQEERKE